MRMTVKGQVTIPAPVRRALHLRPGDQVRFRREGERVIVEKDEGETSEAKLREFDAWLERFAGSAAGCPWTTDEILDMTRGPERR